MSARKRDKKKFKPSAPSPDKPSPEETAAAGAPTREIVVDPDTEPGFGDKAAAEPEPPFGALNWALAVAGVVGLVLGFILLSQANPHGDNWPAAVSPFIILGSYALVFVAIVLRPAPDESDGDPRS